jgi:hypothetical protein
MLSKFDRHQQYIQYPGIPYTVQYLVASDDEQEMGDDDKLKRTSRLPTELHSNRKKRKTLDS